MIGLIINIILYIIIFFCIIGAFANFLWVLSDIHFRDFNSIKYEVRRIILFLFSTILLLGIVMFGVNYKIDKSFQANKIEFTLVGNKYGNASQYYIIYDNKNNISTTQNSDQIEINRGNYNSIKVDILKANNFIGYLGIKKYIFYVPLDYSF